MTTKQLQNPGDQTFVVTGRSSDRRVVRAVVVGHNGEEIGVAWMDRGMISCNWIMQDDFVPVPKIDHIPMSDCPHNMNNDVEWCAPADMPPASRLQRDWRLAPWLGEHAADSFPRELRIIATAGGWATCLIHTERIGTTHHYRAAKACVVAWSTERPGLDEAIALVHRLFG